MSNLIVDLWLSSRVVCGLVCTVTLCVVVTMSGMDCRLFDGASCVLLELDSVGFDLVAYV